MQNFTDFVSEICSFFFSNRQNIKYKSGFGPLASKALPLFVCVIVLTGCSKIPTLNQPLRYGNDVTLVDKMADKALARALGDEGTGISSAIDRNNFIAERMYLIDHEYTEYEARLTHERQDVNFGTAAAGTALNTAAALTPVAQTTRVLSGIAGGVGALGTEYNEKVLLAKSIENIQTQMRANRSDQAAKIYASMKCTIGSYPVAMALSDLEGYYRAGTFTAGLIGLSKTVGAAEAQAKADKNNQSPSGPTAEDLKSVPAPEAVNAAPMLNKQSCTIDPTISLARAGGSDSARRAGNAFAKKKGPMIVGQRN
jgi:hypothetical protein